MLHKRGMAWRGSGPCIHSCMHEKPYGMGRTTREGRESIMEWRGVGSGTVWGHLAHAWLHEKGVNAKVNTNANVAADSQSISQSHGPAPDGWIGIKANTLKYGKVG